MAMEVHVRQPEAWPVYDLDVWDTGPAPKEPDGMVGHGPTRIPGGSRRVLSRSYSRPLTSPRPRPRPRKSRVSAASLSWPTEAETPTTVSV